MREATSTSSSSRVVLTDPACHTVWQIRAVEVRCSYSNSEQLRAMLGQLLGPT
jgi:hypothetical protein